MHLCIVLHSIQTKVFPLGFKIFLCRFGCMFGYVNFLEPDFGLNILILCRIHDIKQALKQSQSISDPPPGVNHSGVGR